MIGTRDIGLEPLLEVPLATNLDSSGSFPSSWTQTIPTHFCSSTAGTRTSTPDANYFTFPEDTTDARTRFEHPYYHKSQRFSAVGYN
jgi:hypothetical protein